jgi:hypothetical protein
MFESLRVLFKLSDRQRQQSYSTQQCYMFRSIGPSSCIDLHNLKQIDASRWSYRTEHVVVLNTIKLSLMIYIYTLLLIYQSRTGWIPSKYLEMLLSGG